MKESKSFKKIKQSKALDIKFIKDFKLFYESINYKNVNLWPVMAPEVYTYYQNPETEFKMKILSMLKYLFTKDKFDVDFSQKNKIFATFLMPRKDHNELMHKMLQNFSKKELYFLDRFEYKMKNWITRFKITLPDVKLLFKIWKDFSKINVSELNKTKYIHFLLRTYHRYKQIEQLCEIYHKLKPKAYIGFCTQGFSEEAILTQLANNDKIPTFTLQHGFIIEYPQFSPNYILIDNLESQNFLIWGKKTKEILMPYIEEKRLILAGNPKVVNSNDIKEKTYKGKKGVIFLPVISHIPISQSMLSLLDDFAQKHPEIHFDLSLHPFDDIKNYVPLKAKNILYTKELKPVSELLKNADYIILHNTTIALEASQYKKPIFRYNDKYLVKLWENDDLFSSTDELENLLKKASNPSIRKRWIQKYHAEFKNNFYQSNKEISQVYYNIILNKIKNHK